MTKTELKREIASIEEQVKQYLRGIEEASGAHQRLLEQYHGVAPGAWVTGTGDSGIEWTGVVVDIDWTYASVKQKPVLKIRAYNPALGNVGMRQRVLTDWKVVKAPKVAA